MRKISLLIGALLLSVVVTTLPLGHASVNYGLFFLSSTAQSGCATKCEQLLRTSGSADTTTSVKDAKTVANFPVDPDVGSSTTTATEGSGTDGNAWVFSTDLGGVQIQSGTWTFHVKTTATSATGTAFIHIQVFSCLTASEGTCTRLITLDDAATNIQATTTATVRTYSGTFGPFNVHFLAVEYWVDQTVASGSTTETITITTVASSTSDIQTPQWNEPLAQSITDASVLTHVTSWKDSLTQTITDASALTHVTSWKRSLTQTITDASALTKIAAHFASLAQTIMVVQTSLSSIAKHFYSLLQSITGIMTMDKTAAHFANVAQSISANALSEKIVAYSDNLLASIQNNLSIQNQSDFKKPLTESITIVSTFRAVSFGETCTITFPIPLLCNYRSFLVESINLFPIQLQFNSYNKMIGEALTLNGNLQRHTNCDSTFCLDLQGSLDTLGGLQAFFGCNLASSRCSGGAGIALAIIGVGIAGVALFLALNKGNHKTRYSYKRRRRF